jgi:hypothetical protein
MPRQGQDLGRRTSRAQQRRNAVERQQEATHRARFETRERQIDDERVGEG